MVNDLSKRSHKQVHSYRWTHQDHVLCIFSGSLLKMLIYPLLKNVKLKGHNIVLEKKFKSFMQALFMRVTLTFNKGYIPNSYTSMTYLYLLHSTQNPTEIIQVFFFFFCTVFHLYSFILIQSSGKFMWTPVPLFIIHLFFCSKKYLLMNLNK